MVSTSIMKLDQLRATKDRMCLIDPKCFDQFVVGVISWYQREVTHPTVYMRDEERFNPKPPNLFNMFEYPNQLAESVTRLFLESAIQRNMDVHGLLYKDAEEMSIDTINSTMHERYPLMVQDTMLLLDAYHLFYCYHEDGYTTPLYFNPAINEVW